MAILNVYLKYSLQSYALSILHFCLHRIAFANKESSLNVFAKGFASNFQVSSILNSRNISIYLSLNPHKSLKMFTRKSLKEKQNTELSQFLCFRFIDKGRVG